MKGTITKSKLSNKAKKDAVGQLSIALNETLEEKRLVYYLGNKPYRFWEDSPEQWNKEEKETYDMLADFLMRAENIIQSL